VTYKKKLIEVALPLATINAESGREKSIRHGHPSTLHLWWARRPLAAARAVLWASLVDDPSAHPELFPSEEDQLTERKRLFDILERLIPWEASNDPAIVAEARAELENSSNGQLPKVVDPFAGGGAIPLEAVRLGLPTFCGDLNPVAVLIERGMLEIPTRFAGRRPVHPDVTSSKAFWDGPLGLAADIHAYGMSIRDEAQRQIGDQYPNAELPAGTSAVAIAWIWARTVKSPDPSWPAHVPLVRGWILARRPRKPVVWIDPIIDSTSKTISYEIRTGGRPLDANVSRNGATCIATGTPIPLDYIREEARAGRMGQTLLAVVAEGHGGRAYLSPSSQPQTDFSIAHTHLPTEQLPSGGLGFRVQNYGLTHWSQLFTDRQLLALSTFSALLTEIRPRIEADAVTAGLPRDDRPLRDGGEGSYAYAEALATYLAFVLDKCADYWSSICTWHNTGEKIRNTFGRQAIPMTWDFAEANPFSSSTGNWMAMVEWVSKAVGMMPTGNPAQIVQRDASALIKEVGECVVSTDPPYYDNVGYADLSDYFYVWLRRNLADIWPDECATLLTPKSDELIADPSRAGSRRAAQEHFESGMKTVFVEAARNASEKGPATIFYAFKATESTEDGITSTGWDYLDRMGNVPP
jgi:putative DNA methylase